MNKEIISAKRTIRKEDKFQRIIKGFSSLFSRFITHAVHFLFPYELNIVLLLSREWKSR